MKRHWQDPKGEPRHADDWLITYADMITLLLCFFAIFLTVTVAKKDGPHKAPVKPAVEAVKVMPPAPQQDLHPLPQVPDIFTNNPTFHPIRQTDFPLADAASNDETEPELQLEAVQTHEVAAPVPTAEEAAPPLPLPATAVLPQMIEQAQANAAGVPKGDRITTLEMNSAAFFGSGSSTLSTDGKVILQDVARRLKADQYKNYQITVEGHTDDTPITTAQFPSNWELSTARAAAVVHFFLDQGLPAARLRAAGYADTFPKLPNRDAGGNPIPANQAQNRRVVIKLEKIEKAAADIAGIQP